MNIFTERYKKLLTDSTFIKELDSSQKSEIINLLFSFDEPSIYSPDRFNPSWTAKTSTSEIVLIDYFKRNDIHQDNLNSVSTDWYHSLNLYELFDIMELWGASLSESIQYDFYSEINKLFEENSLPWRIVSCKLIKIDKQQFEQDLTEKALFQLQALQFSVPVFQTPYEEYMHSISKLSSKEYSDAILYACKSYESILKIMLNVSNANASALTKTYIESDFSKAIPSSFKAMGFKDNVLSALPYMRNNSSAGHGAGLNSGIIPENFARLAVNLAGALNTYLISEYADQQITVNKLGEIDTNDIPF